MKADTPGQYIEQLPGERKEAMTRLRHIITANLPDGFSECMSYGMIGYVIPHSVYPSGYHCDPALPLPFMSIASQKNHISVYHMGLYADEKLMGWFLEEYPKHSKAKPDIGKSCIRFKKPENIPFELICELAGKMQAQEWISLYESQIKR
ncbi:MAG: DUF1801 domain-containing protein [Bacteroidales bacterium]|nr:DUF1801 domain-containing protein [Bacteroidales bacterium]